MNYNIPKSLVKGSEKTYVMSVRVSENMYKDIEKLAEINNISKNEVLKAGIRSLLKK